LSCFFPDCVRELFIAFRADKREVRDPIGFFLLIRVFVFNKLFVTGMDALLELDKINELFSLSLELRSIDAVRFVVDVVLSKKIRINKTKNYRNFFILVRFEDL
jgi:hypothetical protein